MIAPAAARPPAQTAVALTGRDYLSYTQITTYQACPLRWHFQYVEGRPQEVTGASLVFGGSIHAAAESHFRALLAGLPAPGVPELLAAYDEAWQLESALPIQYGRGESAQSLRRLAQRLLAAFVAAPCAGPDGEILGVEETLRGPLIPGLPELLARIDLIVRTDAALVIRDFKTSRSRWTAAKLAEAAPQLLLYGEIATPLAEQFGDLPVQLEFVVLTKTKAPAIDTWVIDVDPGQIGRTKRIISQVWQAMQAGHVYPNPLAMHCATCPFQKACRQWRG